MLEIHTPSKMQQIRSLLFVVISGVFIAIVLAVGMLNYYNPSGEYLAKNVLLEPERALSMRFSEGNSKQKNHTHFIFDRIEFIHYDHTNHPITVRINMQKYAAFYDLVKNETSLSVVSNQIEDLFNQSRIASLHLQVREENDKSTSNAVINFSVVDFLQSGDYYRVQLRTQNSPGSSIPWAYFYHPGIYQDILTLLNKP